MTYIFSATSGATREQLRDLVVQQSFSPGRYAELANLWLNDAVTEVCRRLDIVHGALVLPYDASGLVTQGTPPSNQFWRVDAVYPVDANATGFNEQTVRQAARYQLTPLPWDQALAPLSNAGRPCYYSVRRGFEIANGGSGRNAPVAIRVSPVLAAGKVGVVGQLRPAAMTTDTQTSGLGADVDDALVAFAKARAFRQEDDMDMSNAWRGEFEAALRTLSTSPVEDGPVITPGTWDC